MSLGNLIAELEKHDPNKVVAFGFGDPHSYRGYYDQLAFEPKSEVSVGEMLSDCRGALGATFQGYKGGTYIMDEFTPCWLAEWGDTSDQTIGLPLLRFMLGEPPKDTP